MNFGAGPLPAGDASDRRKRKWDVPETAQQRAQKGAAAIVQKINAVRLLFWRTQLTDDMNITRIIRIFGPAVTMYSLTLPNYRVLGSWVGLSLPNYQGVRMYSLTLPNYLRHAPDLIRSLVFEKF